MSHWNLDKPLLLNHHICTFMPDEDFFLMQMHIYCCFSCLYATHTHLYPGKTWSVLIYVYLIVYVQLTFLKNVISTLHLPFLFIKTMFFWGGNEVLYCSWYEDRSETLSV